LHLYNRVKRFVKWWFSASADSKHLGFLSVSLYSAQMKIHLIAIGDRMPAWVQQGFDEYTKRISGDFKVVLTEISAGKRRKNNDITKLIRLEGEKMLGAIPREGHAVALDAMGQHWNTEELSQRLSVWMASGKDVALMVGGPEGLSPACKERAQECWSLSRLTFPHPLVRVVVAEQLYRAWSILRSHPYHR